MCYCDTHFFTINRGDHFMVADRTDDGEEQLPIYEITPPALIRLIEGAVKCGLATLDTRGTDRFAYVFVQGEWE